MTYEKTGLIVEGGGMRGAYAGGVLEAFYNAHLDFPYMIGVSAGANTLCSFLSKQSGRNKRLYTEWITDKRFINIKNFFTEGAYFGMNFLFDELPTKLDPFDFATFKKCPSTFKVGVTHCETGKIHYLEPLKVATLDEANLILRASSSLPLIAKPVKINGTYYLDGGLANSIPIDESIKDGNVKHVMILTRNADYRKNYSKSIHRLSHLYLRQYPQVVDCIGSRYQAYNKTLDHINKLEKEGTAFILRPEKPLEVDRFEKNPDKLKALFEQGYNQAQSQISSLKTWLTTY